MRRGWRLATRRASSSARKKEVTSEPTGREPAVRENVLAAASTWRQSAEEGEALGELEGAEEGLALGDAEGEELGDVEGEELGDADGASVGTDVGAYGKTLDGHRVPVAALTER